MTAEYQDEYQKDVELYTATSNADNSGIDDCVMEMEFKVNLTVRQARELRKAADALNVHPNSLVTSFVTGQLAGERTSADQPVAYRVTHYQDAKGKKNINVTMYDSLEHATYIYNQYGVACDGCKQGTLEPLFLSRPAAEL